MRIKTTLATAAIMATTAFAATATAATPTQVTIKGSDGDYFGVVKSSDPATCADGRTVSVYKMKGDAPAPKTDKKIGSDTAELSDGKYRWSTGNTGFKKGRFYARVKRTDECGGATSNVIRG